MRIILPDTYIPVPIRWMCSIVEWGTIMHYRWRKWEETTTVDDHGKRLFWAAWAHRCGFGRLAPDPTILLATVAATGAGVAVAGVFKMMAAFVEECPIPSLPFTPQIVPAIAFPFMLAVLVSNVNIASLWTGAVCLGVFALALHRTGIFSGFARYISGETMCPKPDAESVGKEVVA